MELDRYRESEKERGDGEVCVCVCAGSEGLERCVCVCVQAVRDGRLRFPGGFIFLMLSYNIYSQPISSCHVPPTLCISPCLSLTHSLSHTLCVCVCVCVYVSVCVCQHENMFKN